MPRKLPLHVNRQKCGKKWIYYHRIGKGPRTRLPDDPSSPEFKAAWKAAELSAPLPRKKAKDANSKSVRWLVDRYRESASWASLSPATRRQRENIFKQTLEKIGDDDFADFDRAGIQETVDKRAATPAQANVLLKAMRGLFAWAVRNGHLASDPSAGVEPLSYQSDGFPAWSIDDARKFCETWPVGTMQRLAFEFGLVTGLRRSDLHSLGRQHLRGNVLTVKTAKTGTQVTVELPQRLLDIIEATPSPDLHFITGESGKPFAVASFGNWFKKATIKAGLVGKNMHGVRKLAATLSAEAGASSHEIMAQFGWASVRQAEHYTKGADRKRLGMKSSRLVAEQIEASIAQGEFPKAPTSAITSSKRKGK